MFINPIIAMVYDVTNKRWHPIIFDEAPLPGPPDEAKPIRHRSRAHHTAGFDKREDAVASAEDMKLKMKDRSIGEIKLSLDQDLAWDGQGVPTFNLFFITNSSNQIIPAF
jgi:hypothetical protein